MSQIIDIYTNSLYTRLVNKQQTIRFQVSMNWVIHVGLYVYVSQLKDWTKNKLNGNIMCITNKTRTCFFYCSLILHL